MENKSKRGWSWAYKKIWGLHCSKFTSAYRATRYALLGDTGTFYSKVSWQKIRIYR